MGCSVFGRKYPSFRANMAALPVASMIHRQVAVRSGDSGDARSCEPDSGVAELRPPLAIFLFPLYPWRASINRTPTRKPVQVCANRVLRGRLEIRVAGSGNVCRSRHNQQMLDPAGLRTRGATLVSATDDGRGNE